MDDRSESGNAPRTPAWVPVVVALVAVIALAGLGEGYVASNHSKALEQSLSGQTQTTRQSEDALSQKLAQAEETSAQMRGELSVVTDRLQLTQTELTRARRQAQVIKDEDAQQLEAVQAQVQTQLATKADTDDVSKLGNDVNGVKSDLAATQGNLASARDDLGNRIAHNHDELEQLRALGERNYIEFNINAKGPRQKVGDVQVELRGTNVKKNMFTLRLYADDKQFEKKNRAMDEPIYFYTSEYKAPLELVVNQVSKNQVAGYLSVPKVNGQQAPAASSNAVTPDSLKMTAEARPSQN
jgi:chromosome segregation ATPase